ncbi:MAG TPA: hypothetical protein VFY01_10700 [Rheinheimera sp.]|nr:hypothetical protein [Rheinheimera sp.]
MQSLRQYKHYIQLLLLLVLIKFAWLPLWQAKTDNWQRLQQTERNLAKTKALLQLDTEMAQQQQQMRSLLQQTETAVPQSNDIVSYKLALQTRLEALFQQQSLQITTSDWRDGVPDGDVQVLLLDLRFNGKVKHYLELLQILQADSSFSMLSLQADQLSIKGQNQSSMGQVNGRITFKIAVKQEPQT